MSKPVFLDYLNLRCFAVLTIRLPHFKMTGLRYVILLCDRGCHSVLHVYSLPWTEMPILCSTIPVDEHNISICGVIDSRGKIILRMGGEWEVHMGHWFGNRKKELDVGLKYSVNWVHLAQD